MIVAVDFDGTIVDDKHPYDDLATPLTFLPGAREGLYALKAAGHTLVLWSGRARLGLRRDPDFDPLVRAGLKKPWSDWQAKAAVNEGRFLQMLTFIRRELPEIFDYVFEGGELDKPGVDLMIDDRALRLTDTGHKGHAWLDIINQYGTPPDALEPREGMSYETFAARFLALGARPIGHTTTDDRPILRLKTPGPERFKTGPGADVVIIAAQHGEEQAGALALFAAMPDLIRMARTYGVGLRVYPCANPEGFDRVERHNAKEQSPTNTVLSYEVYNYDGTETFWVGELPPGRKYKSVRINKDVAEETRSLVRDLSDVDWSHTFLLDLHQDSVLPEGQAFAYTFGNKRPYESLMQASGAKPLAKTRLLNDSWTDQHIEIQTDARGLVPNFHDGSITDWAARMGSPLVACLETSFYDLKSSVDIARRWIEGFIQMARSV